MNRLTSGLGVVTRAQTFLDNHSKWIGTRVKPVNYLMNKCANAKCQISDLYKIRANFLTSLPNIYFRIRSLGPACAFEPILMPPTIVRVTATTVYYKRVVFTGRPEKGIQFDSLHTLFDTEN